MFKQRTEALTRNQLVGLAASEEQQNLGFGEAKQVAAIGSVMLSTQSYFSANHSADVQATADELETRINNAVNAITASVGADEVAKTPGITLNDAELENIRTSMIIAQNPMSYFKAAKEGRDSSAITPNISGAPEYQRMDLNLTTQSFEQHDMANTLNMTVSYNLSPEKQTAAVELFFPTIEFGADQNNLTIDTHLLTVFNAENNPTSGKVAKYRNAKNMLKGLLDADLLRSDFTKIIPVYRAGEKENNENFVDPAIRAPYTHVNAQGEKIVTAPLTFGEKHYVIALGQTDRMIAAGPSTFKETIAAGTRLSKLVMKIGSTSVEFDGLEMLGISSFIAAQTDDREDMTLRFNTNINILDGNTKDWDNKEIPELALLKSKEMEVQLAFEVYMAGQTDNGWVSGTAGNVKVEMIRPMQKDGVKRTPLDLESAAAQEIIKALGDMELVGYELKLAKTNNNFREHGLILDDRVKRVTYACTLHAPISVVKPHDAKIEVSDSQRINSLYQTSYIRRSNNGIDTIYNILQILKSMPADMDSTEMFGVDTLGVIGQWFVKNYVRDIAIDVAGTVQSMQTSDRLANAFAVLNNLMMTEVTQAYVESELAATCEITNIGNGRFKPHVIAMADTFTRAFIFREGDSRLLGDAYDFTIEECSDLRLRNGQLPGVSGTIFLSFGVPKGGNYNGFLHFGNTLSKQDIPRILSRTRDADYAHEVMVQPWFNHIWHLPVLIRIVVNNLKAAIDSRIPFQVSVVKDEKDGTKPPVTGGGNTGGTGTGG